MTGDQVRPPGLPDVIVRYLRAHKERDVQAALKTFSKDATVTDDGKSYRGLQQIGSWLSSAASEFTYTTEPVAVHRIDRDLYDVVQHLEGNFPGGEVDLHFRFRLQSGAVSQLVIEP